MIISTCKMKLTFELFFRLETFPKLWISPSKLDSLELCSLFLGSWMNELILSC